MAGGGVSMTLEGATQTAAHLAALPKLALAGLASALYLEGLEILAETIPITPVDTSNLRNSGHVTSPRVSGLDVELEVGFGGGAVTYAEIVHEDLTAQHDPPTQAKFLETVVARRGPEFAARLGATFKLATL